MNTKQELQKIIVRAKAVPETPGSEKEILATLISNLDELVVKLMKEEKIAKLKAKIAQIEKES